MAIGLAVGGLKACLLFGISEVLGFRSFGASGFRV